MRFAVELQLRIDPRRTVHFSHRITFENLASELRRHSLRVRAVPTGRAEEPAVRSFFHSASPEPGTRVTVPVVVEPRTMPAEQKGFTHKLIFHGLRNSLQAQFGPIEFESAQSGKDTEAAIRIGFHERVPER